jgi:arylsulfatase A-like enzyme
MSRRASWRPALLFLPGLAVFAITLEARSQPAPRRLNVLFIAVDDLRPQLGCYGSSEIRTPRIDALARRGTVFTRAYCQQAVCSPSRTSLLTGRRPDTTRIYNLVDHFRQNLPEVVTLPQWFKQHGYHAQGLGKIYHGGLDDPPSWSVPSWPSRAQPASPAAATQQARDRQRERQQARRRNRGPSWRAPDVADSDLFDGQLADRAIETLQEVKDRPFFLAVGFHKPHLPFVAPKKYFDLYPPEKIRLPRNPFPPKEAPRMALHNSGELRSYSDIPEAGPISDEKARELIRGYYAASSYADAQIGRVLYELDRLGLREQTVVVLWGDHGWQLGEHGLWCKHANFERATHSPLIVSAPGQKHRGAKTEVLAEFVDIYPTLCELAGLPAPEGLEGTSLVPVMENPRRQWKKAAFSQYPRGRVMGHSMRTDRCRYTEWAEPGQEPVARELYDHRSDPEENANIADRPENRELVQRLSRELRAGWRRALPDGVPARRVEEKTAVK